MLIGGRSFNMKWHMIHSLHLWLTVHLPQLHFHTGMEFGSKRVSFIWVPLLLYFKISLQNVMLLLREDILVIIKPYPDSNKASPGCKCVAQSKNFCEAVIFVSDTRQIPCDLLDYFSLYQFLTGYGWHIHGFHWGVTTIQWSYGGYGGCWSSI